MSDDKSISTLIQALWPGGVAALLQLAVSYAMALKVTPGQLAGSLFMSAIVAACISMLLHDVFHLTPTAAAAFGGMTGVLPAVVMPVVFLRWASKKLGVNLDDFGSVLDELRHQASGKPNDVVPEPTPQPKPEVVNEATQGETK